MATVAPQIKEVEHIPASNFPEVLRLMQSGRPDV